MSFVRQQRTIRQPVAVLGYGYWSGKDVRVEFRPAAAGSGVTFFRDDLPVCPRIAACCENRIEIPRRTCLAAGDAQVEMVEHILATLAGLQIDNCEIGVDQAEMPGCDGSAMAFVAALESVGSVAQAAAVNQLVITDRFRVQEGDSWIEASPDPQSQYSVKYTVHYPHAPVIGIQVAVVTVTPELFCEEVAPCRTFILQQEADQLLRQGLCKRVRSHDLLIFDDKGVVDNELRFSNECARHKALDVIGDMALTGCEIVGKISAHRSGHRLNAKFAGELLRRFATESLRAIA